MFLGHSVLSYLLTLHTGNIFLRELFELYCEWEITWIICDREGLANYQMNYSLTLTLGWTVTIYYTFDNVPVTDMSPAQTSVISVSANSFIMTFCVTLEQHACVVRMSLCVSYQGPAVVYIATRPYMTQTFLNYTGMGHRWADPEILSPRQSAVFDKRQSAAVRD